MGTCTSGVVLTWEPIISAHTVGVGLAVADLIGMNTEWCHRLRVSGRQPLGRSMQQFISQQESSSSTHHSLELDLGQTGPGRVLLQRWHNHIDTCSPSAQAPSTSLALGLEQTQWRKGCNLGSFWTEPQTPAQMAHSFTVITWASLTSALTSFGTELTLKGNGILPNQTLRASTPAAKEQTLPLRGL